MSDKLTVWISGEVILKFDQQFTVTKEEYDYLLENCTWSNISEIGNNSRAFEIIASQLEVDEGYFDEIEVNEIYLEENINEN